VKAQVFKCLPCQVEVSEKLMLSMHLKGKKHQEKLAKLKEGDKPKVNSMIRGLMLKISINSNYNTPITPCRR
jgi:hypothetical protein